MKNKIFLFLFIIPTLFFGCKREEDPVFNKNASTRMTESIENAYNVLQSNKSGWLIQYYPSADLDFGGYTLFANFVSNAEVVLTSDINTDVVKSTYAINPESGAILSFNGYNKVIHYFSEPGIDNGGTGADDTGMRGDFEFIILSASQDSVVLKGKKSGNKILMLPLESNEFETLPKEYQEASENFAQFGVFVIETKEGEEKPLNYNLRSFQDAESANNPLLTFRVVPGGLEFYKEYTLEGVAFNHLKYVSPTEAYKAGYYTDANNSFKIVPKPTPMNLWFKSNLWSMSYSNVGATGKMYWDRAKTSLAASNIVINNMYIGNAGVEVVYYKLQNGNVEGAVGHTITLVPDSSDEVIITFTGSLYNVRNFNATYWSAGLNQFTTPLNGRRFKITSEKIEKPDSITLTDVQIPTNTYKVFLEDIDDPLNN